MTAALNTAMEGGDPTTIADAEADLMESQEKVYTEHVFVNVNVYDEMGMMMGSAVLCLAEHQFGYVVLQGPEDMGMDHLRGAVLSVMDGDIPEYGYAKVVAESRKFTGCGATAPNTLMNVITGTGADGMANTEGTAMADTQVASWAIIQDVGMGFFGTEVQNATVSMAQLQGAEAQDPAPATDAGDPELACYSAVGVRPVQDTDGEITTAGRTMNTNGDFTMTRCGLIPERHDNSRDAMGALVITPDTSTPITLTNTDRDAERIVAMAATPRGHAFARYDAGDESMVYVWLAHGMDTEDTMPSERRMLEVVVKCEDGMVVMDADIDGNPGPIMVPAPTMITMLDPHGDALDPFVHMCAGDRGVLQITMPNGSTAGSVFQSCHADGRSLSHELPWLQHGQSDDLL